MYNTPTTTTSEKKLKNGEKNLITIIDVESIGQTQHQQLYSREIIDAVQSNGFARIATGFQTRVCVHVLKYV